MRQDRERQHQPWKAFSELTGIDFPSQDLVDFVLPNLGRDIPRGMYITMRLAERHPNPLVSVMYDTAQEFFGLLELELKDARDGDIDALRRARRMASFPEAPEIGFGYTSDGWDGRGIGSGSLNHDIVDALLHHRGISLNCCLEPDTIGFIDGVGLDRASDAIATICKSHLIEYTQEQAGLLGFRDECMKRVEIPHVWDPQQHVRTSVTAEVPATDDGRAVLLVPKKVVRSSFPVRPEQYARYHGIRGDTATVKEKIMEQNQDNPGRLRRVMKRVLEEPKNYRPRREFRDEEEDE